MCVGVVIIKMIYLKSYNLKVKYLNASSKKSYFYACKGHCYLKIKS